MNRSLPTLVAGALLVVILGLYMITFQVRFTEVAVVKTFGKARAPDPATGESPDVITEPGLCFRWPWPIQEVDKYDNRIQVTATTGEEMPTRDDKPIIVTTAIGWRISEPHRFNRTTGTMKEGENKLKTLVRDAQKTVVGRYDFHTLVSTDPNELRYDRIEREILSAIKQRADDLYGIDVVSTGIERLALPQRITESVFEAMKKERQAEVARVTSEGESRADTIKATAEGTAKTILTFAERKAEEIVNEGLARANRYNEVFRKDEPLALFLLKVENLHKLFREKSTTVVFDLNSPLLDVLSEGTAPTTRPAEALPGTDLIAAPPPDLIRP
jgi:modulator of FtsH protease HflC